MRLSDQVENQTKINNRLNKLESENKELKESIEILTQSLLISAKSLEEIAFLQKNHLAETETLLIVVNQLNSILNPKNDYLKYDLMNEPHN